MEKVKKKEEFKKALRIEINDQGLLNRFKSCCAARGKSMKEVVTHYLESYVAEDPQIFDELNK